jgi:CO dehydrogenase maturation factor
LLVMIFGVMDNMVADRADRDYPRASVGDALLATVGLSSWVRAAERGASPALGELEPTNRDALDAVRRELDGTERNWAAYQRGTVDFHRRNVLSWANVTLGVDLTG